MVLQLIAHRFLRLPDKPFSLPTLALVGPSHPSPCLQLAAVLQTKLDAAEPRRRVAQDVRFHLWRGGLLAVGEGGGLLKGSGAFCGHSVSR